MSSDFIAMASALIALVAAGAAWTAVIMQRRSATDNIKAQVNIGARNSRAAVVSANRQKWIDAVRDDISEFIATKYRVGVLKCAGSFRGEGQDALLAEERELRAGLIMLRVRIELRINHEEIEHTELLQAMDRFDQEASSAADIEVRTQASAIFKAEWERLKKEAAEIEPFVRELP